MFMQGILYIKLCNVLGITKLEVMDPPRVIKTHLPIQLVPRSFWEAGCKVKISFYVL